MVTDIPARTAVIILKEVEVILGELMMMTAHVANNTAVVRDSMNTLESLITLKVEWFT